VRSDDGHTYRIEHDVVCYVSHMWGEVLTSAEALGLHLTSRRFEGAVLRPMRILSSGCSFRVFTDCILLRPLVTHASVKGAISRGKSAEPLYTAGPSYDWFPPFVSIALQRTLG
jgi:hypothetical protein